MRERKLVITYVVFVTFIFVSHGCQITDHPQWQMPINTSILDTFEVGDIVISLSTTDIEAIDIVSFGQGTISGPYFDLSIENSQLLVRTNAMFARYEEVEVASRVIITVNFICTGGGTRDGLTFWIDITDTNNNPPEFIPNNELEFIITPPLPPDFLITGCLNDVITVRDIDLTTYQINFTIADNPYFEIEYDADASIVAKEFVAQLRTKTFLRSLSEPLTLSITATDVDRTDDPPHTAIGTVRIVADSEFQFPEELVFNQTFYLANYTDDHQLNLLETISLRQGFDEYVNFALEGGYEEYFDLRVDGNQVSLVVLRSLPSEEWSEGQIFLIIRAEREFTSGASTTVIVQFPEVIELQFERAFYEGVIAKNVLQVTPLVLSQGYEGVTVSAEVIGEYTSYFTATVQSDLVTLTMTPLMEDVIDNNSFVSFQVVAASDRSSASTVVNLEIIKDDNNTPLFDKSIYVGSYDPVTGLSMEEIRFVQGFDDTVAVNLTGDYADLFQIVEIGHELIITSSTIPPEVFSEQNILIVIEASKPRTVGANAVIHIALPAARELEFEESTYRGYIEGSLLSLQHILLLQGYEEEVSFNLSGEYSTYFNTSNERDLVTIELFRPLPDIAITENSVIMLTLAASGLNAITTTTSVLLDIIKDDKTTPVFNLSIYYGTYSEGAIEIEAINLAQGFDSSVSFRIDGAHAQYFAISNDNVNNAVITLRLPIPEDEIFREKVLLFNVLADKALTVGANAAVLIRFPTELTDAAIMRFSRHTYLGTLEENVIHLDEIALETGFAPGTEFIISGEYVDHLSWTVTNNMLQISSSHTLPHEVLEENDFIVLEIEARRARAVSVWTSAIIDIVKKEVIAPVFGQAYYRGAYTEETGLTFEEIINLSEGYDETVTLALSGEPEAWFSIEQEGEYWTLVSRSSVPREVLEKNSQLLFTIVANKLNATSGRAVISLDLPKDSTFRFQQDFYKGYFENGNLTMNEIILEDYTNDVNYTFKGDYLDYFQLTNENGTFTIELQTITSLPEETNVFVFTLEAQNAIIRTHTVIIIENVRTNFEISQIEFEEPYYIGTYSSTAEHLQFDANMRLTSETNQNVTFYLEGDDAEWFSLMPNGNSVDLTLTNSIPTAVIANNQQLVFVVTAQSLGSATARATVVISLIDSFPEGSAMLGFDRVTYLGSIEDNQANIPTITLREGFTEDVEFSLYGELESYFSLSPQGAVVTVTLLDDIPEHLIPANRIIVLEIRASAPQAVTTYATIVIQYVVEDDSHPLVELIFAQTFYNGSYAAEAGLSFPTAISLTQGFDSNVEFALEGDDAEWFSLMPNGNSVDLTLTNSIPTAVIANNQQLVFVVTAQSLGSATARATVVISLVDSFPEGSALLGFDRVTYLGSIEDNQANIPTITLREGFTEDVEFSLYGELESYFSLSPQGAVVTVTLLDDIPEHLIPANRIIVLEIRASAPQAVTTYATIVIQYVVEDDSHPLVELIFAQTFYNGSYAAEAGLSFPTAISLTQGFDSNVEFALEGDDAEWFSLMPNGNSVDLTLTNSIPTAVIANNQQLVFVVTAQSLGSATARATVVISLVDSFPEGSALLGFDRVTYLGSIEDNQANIPTITLREGFTEDVEFSLYGELESYFSLSPQGAVVTVTLLDDIPEHLIPANRIIVLEIRASAPQAVTTYATIVIQYVVEDDSHPLVELIFAQTFYNGSYAAEAGLSFPTAISLTQGYDSNVEFALEGDDAEWFSLMPTGNSVDLTLTNSIPTAVIANNQQLVFVVTAQSLGSATARATVVIYLVDYLQPGSDVTFDKVLYEGFVQNGLVNHESITVIGFSGATIELHGVYSPLFVAVLLNDRVTVSASSSLTLPSNVTHTALELHAGTAAAVLVFNIVQTDVPSTPTVTFSSPSYAVRVEISHTGLVGQVQATADNGEAVTYSLQLDNAHLQERLRINGEGELHLSAPLNTGIYTFEVVATTVFTQIPGTATVHLSVEVVTVCGNDLVMPPLIILNVDEEEPHYDLINGTQYDDCHFTLTNRWPLDQTWVYVDEEGLHTTAIDREHESIAFMVVSQVQVEVILHCEGDSTRIKRSLASDTLGPYDYGSNKWILTDTVVFNSRRSLVNIIVNDINDNVPIFVGKDNEPIAVGYPVPELAERVLPRSLAELHATDADIGENAALSYWSSASELAVSPTTGFVHLRDGATLENGARLTVSVTDRNGAGLTGSVDILVRLLDENYIAVVTVRDAFLDDEETVLSSLSEGVGYEIKVLRSVVISAEVETEALRRKRDVTSASGASLQLYVYGMVAREPVSVEQLTADISNIVTAPVIIASSVSLQDHLEGQEICVIAGRDTGLLVATIVLSVLLFIVLVLIAVWFFLRWRKNRNYDQFSDENSLTSGNASADIFPKPQVVPNPRLDIAELKKSERRLQEMLDEPVQEISVEPKSSKNDAILNISETIKPNLRIGGMPEPMTPVFIQSIDKLKDAADESSDDEFGEIKTPRRKSVVTFNENVEKIIHLQDDPDDNEDLSMDPDYEVYKL